VQLAYQAGLAPVAGLARAARHDARRVSSRGAPRS